MPKRPQQHQIEDESISRFKLLLPKHWIVRELPKDYGIDLQVGLVDSNENVTGKMFYVQLKATDAKDDKIIKKVSIGRDKKAFYGNLDSPISVVRYSRATNTFYYKWVNHIKDREDRKKITIEFDDNNILNEENSLDLEMYVDRFHEIRKGELKLPLKVEILIQNNTLFGSNPVTAEAAIETYFRNISSMIDFVRRPNNQFTISLKKKVVIINASELFTVTFHIAKRRDEVLYYIIVGIAMILNRIKKPDLSAQLIFKYSALDFILKNEIFLEMIVPYLIKTDYLEETLRAIETYENSMTIQFMTLSVLRDIVQETNPKRRLIIKEYWMSRVKKAMELGDSKSTALANYNLGNFCKREGEYLKAVNFYQKARKSHSIYDGQWYFYSDLGGVFFELKRFRLAAKLYKKSLDLKNQKSVIALYADSLMFSGQYAEALHNFELYLNNDEMPKSEFVLAHYGLSYMMEKYAISVQNRSSNKADDVFKKGSTLTIDEQIQLAFTYDLLSDIAWYNKAAKHIERGQKEDAAVSFVMAGLLCTGDSEAWANATLSFLNTESLGLMYHAIRAAYFFNRESFVTEVLSKLTESKLPENRLKSIKDSIFAIVDDIKYKKEEATVRIDDGTGEFVDFRKIVLKALNEKERL